MIMMMETTGNYSLFCLFLTSVPPGLSHTLSLSSALIWPLGLLVFFIKLMELPHSEPQPVPGGGRPARLSFDRDEFSSNDDAAAAAASASNLISSSSPGITASSFALQDPFFLNVPISSSCPSSLSSSPSITQLLSHESITTLPQKLRLASVQKDESFDLCLKIILQLAFFPTR